MKRAELKRTLRRLTKAAIATERPVECGFAIYRKTDPAGESSRAAFNAGAAYMFMQFCVVLNDEKISLGDFMGAIAAELEDQIKDLP